MKPIRPQTWILSLLLFGSLLLVFSCVAADAPPGSTAASFSWLKLTWVQYGIIVGVPSLIAGLKKLWPSLPGPLIPWLAPVLGFAADYATKLAGADHNNPELALALGGLGVWLREAFDQAKKSMRDGTSFPLALIPMVALCLMASPGLAAEQPLFRAGEVGLDFFGSARTVNMTDYRTGAGAGVSWFPFRTAGVRGELLTENTQHSFVDAAGATLLGRLPFEPLRLAIEYGIGFNGHFDQNPWIEKDTFTVHAELGARFRLVRNADIFAKVRGVRPVQTSDGEHLQFILGTGFNW